MMREHGRELSERYDAVVVGARAAGASTAMLLARMGLRVLALDRSREGSDTLSTHALMRAGVLQLHRWGVLETIRESKAPAIGVTTFHYADESIPIVIKPRDGVDALVAPRRTVLDPVLADAAREAGAHVRYGMSVADLTRNASGRVDGVVVQGRDGVRRIGAGIVIGADGMHSRVARLAGARVERMARHAAAVIYGYVPATVEGYHWHYRPGVSVGAIPTNDGLMALFVSTTPQRFLEGVSGGMETMYRQLLAEGSPELAAATAEAAVAGKLHPFAGTRGFLRQPWGPGWALVGDAGYFKDPITAHGITDALADAEALARAVAAGGEQALMDYHLARNARAVEFMDVTDAIAAFDWNLEQVKELHLRLSRLMAQETREVAARYGTESYRTPLVTTNSPGIA
jgi:2-polyprenyl-6-methoxyphenol hydroxylase-like FAD-dependent oxidoreductase